MKKFRLFDEDGDEVELEEVMAEEPDKTSEMHDEELTPEEISALKDLAAVAPKLVALVNQQEEPMEEPVEDRCEDEEEIEEVIDTEEPVKPMKRDSKASYGSVEKKEKIEDSVEEDAVSIAWQKRYGG